jgi:hypothetical protein
MPNGDQTQDPGGERDYNQPSQSGEYVTHNPETAPTYISSTPGGDIAPTYVPPQPNEYTAPTYVPSQPLGNATPDVGTAPTNQPSQPSWPPINPNAGTGPTNQPSQPSWPPITPNVNTGPTNQPSQPSWPPITPNIGTGTGPSPQSPQSGGYISQNFGVRPTDPGLQPSWPVIQSPTGGPHARLQPQKKNPWKTATLVLFIITLILAGSTAFSIYYIIHSPAGSGTGIVNGTTVPGQTPASNPTQPGQPTATAPANATPTAPTSSPNNYSAIQPGPGCDKNGGTWSSQGISNISCGTTVTVSAANTRGYLFLQLPNNKAFSSNNKIGVIGSPSSSQCVGLDEQDANTGFLVEYCGDGHWFIYTISSDGTIVQTLDKNLTSTRTNADISLTLKGTTLSFSIDNEIYNVNSISPIQPIKVAITYFSIYSGDRITTNNFSYTVLTS